MEKLSAQSIEKYLSWLRDSGDQQIKRIEEERAKRDQRYQDFINNKCLDQENGLVPKKSDEQIRQEEIRAKAMASIKRQKEQG